MNINEKTHPHNAVFCEMLESVIDGTPKTVQYRGYESGNWRDLSWGTDDVTEFEWNPQAFYRIKPTAPVMVTRAVTYPAPMKGAPATINDRYFVCLPDGVDIHPWANDRQDNKWLAAGVCHLTREAAQEQWQAFFGVQN